MATKEEQAYVDGFFDLFVHAITGSKVEILENRVRRFVNSRAFTDIRGEREDCEDNLNYKLQH